MWSEDCNFQDYIGDGKFIIYLGICHADLRKGPRALIEWSRKVRSSQLCRIYGLKNKWLGEGKFEVFDFNKWLNNTYTQNMTLFPLTSRL